MNNTLQDNTISRGFTLVEILVVIAIISILIGLLVPTVSYFQYQSRKQSVQSELQRIASALESYNSDFGDYPPSTLNGVKDHEGNDINQGNESLTAFLMTEKNGGPYLDWPADRFQNGDKDRAEENLTGWYFGHNKLLEMEDAWNHPFVYFHSDDYESYKKYRKYRSENGLTFEGKPVKSEETAAYRGKFSFQLWSIGVDGKSGTADDIRP